MSAHLKKKEERLLQVLERLMLESSKGIPIIVEGKRDIEALRKLGVEGEIISAKTGGKSQLEVFCQIESRGLRQLIMLFDFDRRGREMTETFGRRLERARIRSNIAFWNELSGLIRRDVKDIEGLASYMDTLKRKTRET